MEKRTSPVWVLWFPYESHLHAGIFIRLTAENLFSITRYRKRINASNIFVLIDIYITCAIIVLLFELRIRTIQYHVTYFTSTFNDQKPNNIF